MPARLRVFVLAIMASMSASIAGAQENAVPQPETRAERTGDQRIGHPAGPRMDVTATALRMTQPTDSAASLQRSRQNVGKPVALMIVGGAAIVLGSVVDNEVGTLIVIGGVVALLYGLYQYLQ